MEKEKKFNLLKLVGIAFLLYVVLTWFVPTGSFSSGEFVKGETNPLGLYGLFTAPIYSFAVFAQYFVLILCIGGFYGVLNRTGSYQKIVKWFSSKNRTKFLVVTVLIFSLITSVLGETMMVFVLLPFFIAVLLNMGYDKLSSLGATIGGSLVGMVASISGNMAIYKNYFGLKPNMFVLFNIILYIVLVFLLCMFIISKAKKSDSKKLKNDDIPLYEVVKDSKKSSVPLVIVLSILVLVLLLGLFNWYYAFGIDIFVNLHEKITSFEMFNTNIVSKVFGNFSEIGYFTNYDVSAILVVSSVLIAWIYSFKMDDYIESFKEGSKKMVVPGLYVVLASVIFSQVVTASNGNISLTISNSLLKLSDDFNILTGLVTGICGSFFYNDYLYFMNGIYGIVSLYNASMMPFILTVFQSIFGIMMFILPVSILLIGGLRYLNVSYKDWIKYIWKFLIQIFSICVIGCVILSMIV